MRIGHNPYKDKPNQNSEYLHQMVIPVFIPNQSDYFKESFKVLKLCLQSIFATTHNKTFITVVNNGSCLEIQQYLDKLFETNQIHEIIHTQNIGKLNAILKGLAGNNIELVTISDSDVLFINGWQQETISVFNQISKVGVVGIVPQFNMHKVNSFNILFDNLFNKKIRFLPIKNPDDLSKFYDSIAWDKNYNHDYLKFSLGLVWNQDLNVLIGSGHFVATYKKDIFEQIISNIPYKMGGNSESYLDEIPLEKDYWRVTTCNNYAYHIGNTIEDWMFEINKEIVIVNNETINYGFDKLNKISKLKFLLKNKILQIILKNNSCYKIFLKWKKLPTKMIKNY